MVPRYAVALGGSPPSQMSLDLLRVVSVLSSGTYDMVHTPDGQPVMIFSSYHPADVVRAGILQAVGVGAQAGLLLDVGDGT